MTRGEGRLKLELLPDGENSLVLGEQLNGAVLVGSKELRAIYRIHHCRGSNALVVLGVSFSKCKTPAREAGKSAGRGSQGQRLQ
jgi:hypothetical protein